VEFRQKVVVITGAATATGQVTAQLFARTGAEVVVADLNERDGNEAVNRISRDGGNAWFVRIDVFSRSDVKALMQTVADSSGGIDTIINIPGVQCLGQANEFEEDRAMLAYLFLKSCFMSAKSMACRTSENEAGGR
jgi:NAD(P)-dependent dehydrogenase (short-subunit alcohol dehydrogenase family)